MRTADKVKLKMLEGLNQQQEKAVTFDQGPLLIIAGAGTGKTTVITKRIAWLIENKFAEPGEILALTFTEKTANEMAQRVDEIMPLGYSEIQISTFHAFAQQVLRDHALDIGLPGDFKILSETQAWILIQSRLSEFELEYYRPMGNPTKFIHALLDHFDKAKRESVTPEKYLKYAEAMNLDQDNANGSEDQESVRIKEIANAYHKYQKFLLDAGFLDYNDLINYTLQLFKSRPNILSQFRKKFKYVLVDEFQDTDLAQYELVKLLAQPANNITVVGDDDQSIYKFRGASISNILKFQDDYPDLAKVTLVDNYRSTQSILDMAYGFIQQNNPERLESKLKISKKLLSHNNNDGEIKVLHADTSHNEAAMVINKILELVLNHGFNYNDFAILVRANDHADPFLAELTKRNISYMFVANRGLYKKPFILDLLAYLRLLDNYHESDNLFRVLSFPKFRIATNDLISITQSTKKKGLSLYDVISQINALTHISEDSYKKINEFLTLLHRHSTLARERHVTELLMRILEDLGILDDLTENASEKAEEIGLLRKFYGKAQTMETESDDKTIKAFLNLIRMEQQSGNTGELAFDPNVGPESVKVMTIHSSKGLEFKCVFVANMVEARFPSRDRKEQIELPESLVNEIFSPGDVHLMEERRLFYVAATRAKQFLYFSWADNYGGVTSKKTSRFLVEAGLASDSSKPKPTGEVLFEPAKPVEVPDPERLPIPESFSWTSVSSFLKCPLEYKYKYLYQIPWPGNPYTSFGSSIHKAIQLFSQLLIQTRSAKQGDLFASSDEREFEYPQLKKLYKFYEENWIDDWYEHKVQQKEFKERGYRLLKNYYDRLISGKLVPYEAEKFFKLKLGPYKYVGVIDCIFQNADGSVNIVDYKTSQKAREKLEKVEKKQLLAYQLAAGEFLKLKVNNLSYWDLEDLTKAVEFLGEPAELEAIKQEFQKNIEEIIEAVKTDSFYQLDLKRPSHECKFRHLES
ncbi:MAG: ATP-dependent DNA helicase [Candidatus Doudnabacteria bacterium]